MPKAEPDWLETERPLGEAGRLSPELLEELRIAYLESVRGDLEALDSLTEDLLQDRRPWRESLERLRRVVHNIKGQGASFGYPLMTELGESLHQLLRDAPGAERPAAVSEAKEVIQLHVLCLRRVIEGDLKGEPDAKGQSLVERLTALSRRVTGVKAGPGTNGAL